MTKHGSSNDDVIQSLKHFQEAIKKHRRARGTNQESNANLGVWIAAEDAIAIALAIHGKSDFVQLPTAIARFVHDRLSEVVSNNLSSSAFAFRRIGAPGYQNGELGLIKDAFVYIEMAKKKLVDDRSPVKTVIKAYNIERDTYHDWRTRYQKTLEEAQSTVQKAFNKRKTVAGIDPTWTVDDDQRSNLLRTKMQESGSIYQNFVARSL